MRVKMIKRLHFLPLLSQICLLFEPLMVRLKLWEFLYNRGKIGLRPSMPADKKNLTAPDINCLQKSKYKTHLNA